MVAMVAMRCMWMTYGPCVCCGEVWAACGGHGGHGVSVEYLWAMYELCIWVMCV